MSRSRRKREKGYASKRSGQSLRQVLHKRRPPVGSKPGTLAIDDQAPSPKISAAAFAPDALEETDLATVEQLKSFMEKHRGRTCWFDVQGLGDEQMIRQIGDLFSLHPLALEDVVHVPQRPKTEIYPDHHLLIARMIRLADNGHLDVEQVSIFIGPQYVLTFQERHGDVLDPVRHRMRSGSTIMRRHGADYLAYAIYDTIIDAYFPVIEHLGDRLDELEQRISEHANSGILDELRSIRLMLLNLRRATWPQREATNALVRDESPMISEAVRLYFRDTHDHCVQIAEVTETYRELISGLMNMHLMVIGQRTNDIMKVLTMVASIFIPLTFIAGVYGMNFEVMPELGWWWSYPAVLLLMLGISVAMTVYFFRQGWLHGSGHRQGHSEAEEAQEARETGDPDRTP